MKICLITNLYEPYNRGGAEKIVKLTAEKMIKEGHDVLIITSNKKRGEEKEKREQIEIIRFYPWNIFAYYNINKYPSFLRLIWHFFDLFNLQSAFKVYKILKEEKPDKVFTHNLKGLGYLIPWVINKLKIKHTHFLHDIQLINPTGLLIKGQENSFLNKGLPTKIYQFFCRKLFKNVKNIISPSNWILDFHLEKNFFFKSYSKVIKNPCEVFKNSPHLKAGESKLNKKINITKLTFLFIGQVEKHKGVYWLIKVFQELPQHNLIIIGDGKDFKSCKSLTKNNKNIKFIGKLFDPIKKTEIFKLSDFLIMPSLCYENSPTVIYEAYQHSLPVLASNLGGTPELIKVGETGCLFEAQNTESFWKSLDDIKTCDYSQMQKNCLEKLKDYSIENYLNLILK